MIVDVHDMVDALVAVNAQVVGLAVGHSLNLTAVGQRKQLLPQDVARRVEAEQTGSSRIRSE